MKILCGKPSKNSGIVPFLCTSNTIFVRETQHQKSKKRLEFQRAHIVRQSERLLRRISEGGWIQGNDCSVIAIGIPATIALRHPETSATPQRLAAPQSFDICSTRISKVDAIPLCPPIAHRTHGRRQRGIHKAYERGGRSRPSVISHGISQRVKPQRKAASTRDPRPRRESRRPHRRNHPRHPRHRRPWNAGKS